MQLAAMSHTLLVGPYLYKSLYMNTLTLLMFGVDSEYFLHDYGVCTA